MKKHVTERKARKVVAEIVTWFESTIVSHTQNEHELRIARSITEEFVRTLEKGPAMKQIVDAVSTSDEAASRYVDNMKRHAFSLIRHSFRTKARELAPNNDASVAVTLLDRIVETLIFGRPLAS